MKSFAAASIISISTICSASAFTATGKSPLVAAPVGIRQEWTTGVEIELPNFETLFDRVQRASPLAKHVMEGNVGGFDALATSSDSLKWKKIENNVRNTVHRIDKLDSYQNIKTPLLRFRSSIKGPLIAERFSHFIMDLDERKRWDDACARNEEVYPIDDLDAVNTIIGDNDKYGTCTRIGVGYTATKQSIISPREQLIIGGVQDFKNGASMLWGTEMEEQHNYLLPEGQRHTRAKSHLFAATLAPTADGFDVEYLLQMDIGGNVPAFLTTPALVDAIKKLFEHTKKYFGGGEGSELDLHLKRLQQSSDLEVLRDDIDESYSVEMDFSREKDVSMHLHDDASLLPLIFTP